MRDVLRDWHADLDPGCQSVLSGIEPDFPAIDPALELGAWRPVFPVRRGKRMPGAPQGGHMLRALDGITPECVRRVVIGQTPYPDPRFSTGRTFEAGNVAEQRKPDQLLSVSVRTFPSGLWRRASEATVTRGPRKSSAACWPAL